jgi:hypothetical protein
VEKCPFDLTPYKSGANGTRPQIFSLNYTNQDFWSMKSRLVSYIKEKFGTEFNDFVESSLGIMLIENWAFIADTLSFKTDQIANEVFIDTVTELENAIRLANLVGFVPKPPIAGKSLWTARVPNTYNVDLVIQTPYAVDIFNNNVTTTIELFASDALGRPIFDENIIITSGSLINSNIVGIEGRTYTDTFAGTGGTDQAYLLNFSPVLLDSIRVSVDGVTWEQVKYFTESAPKREYRVEYNSDYSVFIIFGNNRAGYIPPTGSTIVATYRVGGGTSGNIVTNFVNAASHIVGSSFIANATALVHTGYANVTTSVNSALLTVGTNFIANATALVHTGSANVTGAVNASSHTVGTNFIANATALVHTGYANVTGAINASSHTVGTTFTANATLVNAAAINVTGQVNTATFYVATSANVGSNVQVTTSQLFIGNATVNSFANSVMLKVSNSTAYTSIEPGSVSLTGASITTGVASFTGLTINTNYEIQVLANTDLGINTTSALVIYTFPTTYSSAKILAQVRRTGNTQTSDMIVAHDGTDAFISVYGTVISPSTSADLGDFSVGINGSNVELKYKQTGTNSAVKLAAHLIKT